MPLLLLRLVNIHADDKVDVNSTAALMKVIITIYNMEEAITKS